MQGTALFIPNYKSFWYSFYAPGYIFSLERRECFAFAQTPLSSYTYTFFLLPGACMYIYLYIIYIILLKLKDNRETTAVRCGKDR
jgi:hypothetical protein